MPKKTKEELLKEFGKEAKDESISKTSCADKSKDKKPPKQSNTKKSSKQADEVSNFETDDNLFEPPKKTTSSKPKSSLKPKAQSSNLSFSNDPADQLDSKTKAMLDKKKKLFSKAESDLKLILQQQSNIDEYLNDTNNHPPIHKLFDIMEEISLLVFKDDIIDTTRQVSVGEPPILQALKQLTSIFADTEEDSQYLNLQYSIKLSKKRNSDDTMREPILKYMGFEVLSVYKAEDVENKKKDKTTKENQTDEFYIYHSIHF